MKHPARIMLLTFLILYIVGCTSKHKEPVDYINPFIGTGGHGHTYPGAVVPFGMVQLSPDTRKDSWDGCSGYHYSDSIIYGFSHTHLSGTGIGDYGDVRLMPMTGKIRLQPGYVDAETGYGSRFSHDREEAKAGYYNVHLEDYGIDVELTATAHAGFHSYRFLEGGETHILLDLVESVVSEELLDTRIQIVSNTEVSGIRRTSGWAADQNVCFYIVFSKPFISYGFVGEEGVQYENSLGDGIRKAYFKFETAPDEVIRVRVGISAVDEEGARNNLLAEIPGWDLKEVSDRARKKWADEISRIDVGEATDEDLEIFYTALYHTMLAPNIYSDADGRYRGHDHQIHRDEARNMYTVFSLWDTFRTLHPLFAIIERERTADLVNSMLDMYSADGHLPVWELASCETFCMIGYHAVPVIVDAYAKGVRGFDAKLALEAMQATAEADRFGLDWYRKKGYIPADKEGSSVSKTLEYAYDDWCIAEMARMLDDESVYNTYIRRAQYYKNLFDPESGFFRGRSNGGFVTPFDPTEVNFMLTEANTWQYNFFVPQDVNTHIDLLGGEEGYVAMLDKLFTSGEGLSGRHQSDITGLIGQYAHGNEPSHHMAYLYNYAGKPWKTQQLVHRIMSDLYSDRPDGLSGNEDCGQMSAWYVMSALGFYPVTPGSDVYVLGTPAFSHVDLNLENGKKFTVRAEGLGPGSFYVQKVRYNGEPWTRSYITHKMIMDGGLLEFVLADTPDTLFGSSPGNRPVQQITGHLITPVPFFKAPSRTFEKQMEVEIAAVEHGADISWSRRGQDKGYKPYREPITLTRNTTLYARSGNGGTESFVEEAEYVKIPAGMSVTVKYPYSPQYTAGGDLALVNTIRGGEQFTTGNWQGYYGDDLVATIDLGKTIRLSAAGAGFLQDQNSWIFMPEWVKFELSGDGRTFTEAGTIVNDIDAHADGAIKKDFTVSFPKQKARYLRITAKNRAICPEWHKGYPEPSWIFADEVWWK